jgi:uncharacterized damage-inducible protein DinB
MFRTIEDAVTLLRHESAGTARVLVALTDESLSHHSSERQRTIGELAWHIVVSQREIAGRTGLEWNAPSKKDRSPRSVATIHSVYVDSAKALLSALERQWTDETLRTEDEIYGERWRRGRTLLVMLLHEVHHRGQLTALMRGAGLRVPGVYGPSADERES